MKKNTITLNSNGMPQRKLIGIKVPLYVIDYFKEEAVRTGIPYQTLINHYLEDCVKQNGILMPENRTLAEQVEVQKARVATEQQRLEELLVRLRTEHSDDKRAYNELLSEFGRLIERKLNRQLTKDDVFRFERFLICRSIDSFFPEWMNKPLNDKKSKEKQNE